MNNSNIIILTGPIKAGKTTFLKGLFDSRTDCSGFLTPDICGKRYLYKLDDKSMYEFEVENDKKFKIVKIGKFIFKKETFDLGSELIESKLNTNYPYFIIDELGKLELKNQGFGKVLTDEFWKNVYKSKARLILVIRDYLVNEVIKKYKIESPVIIDINDPEHKVKFIAACAF